MVDACTPTKLFIGGISRHTTTKHLRDHFLRYGQVLDCVAMRTQDGQPRGFGYVTLDSFAGAQCVLAEPQVIDNRVVDMKLAVPEGSQGGGVFPSGNSQNKAASKGNAAMRRANAHTYAAASAMHAAESQNMMFPWWDNWSSPMGAAGYPSYDSSLMPPQMLSCDPSQYFLPPLQDQGARKMSADAAEFLPTAVSKPPGILCSPTKNRTSLGDITNSICKSPARVGCGPTKLGSPAFVKVLDNHFLETFTPKSQAPLIAAPPGLEMLLADAENCSPAILSNKMQDASRAAAFHSRGWANLGA